MPTHRGCRQLHKRFAKLTSPVTTLGDDLGRDGAGDVAASLARSGAVKDDVAVGEGDLRELLSPSLSVVASVSDETDS